MKRRLLTLAVAAAVAAIVAVSQTQRAKGASASDARTIAAASSIDYRVAVRAHRVLGQTVPTAYVVAAAYRRSGAGWRALSSTRLKQVLFWNTVTSPHAVCRLEFATAAPSPRVSLQLLQSPSLGCGQMLTVRLR